MDGCRKDTCCVVGVGISDLGVGAAWRSKASGNMANVDRHDRSPTWFDVASRPLCKWQKAPSAGVWCAVVSQAAIRSLIARKRSLSAITRGHRRDALSWVSATPLPHIADTRSRRSSPRVADIGLHGQASSPPRPTNWAVTTWAAPNRRSAAWTDTIATSRGADAVTWVVSLPLAVPGMAIAPSEGHR